jgi:hypothetical protein
MQTYVPTSRAADQRFSSLTGVFILVVSVLIGVISPMVLG